MSFDSEDSEINFIRGYEIAAERDVLCECPQSSSLTSSDNEAAAYADDPLVDKKDIELPKACRCRQKTRLDEDLKDRLEGNVEVRNCFVRFFFSRKSFEVNLTC